MGIGLAALGYLVRVPWRVAAGALAGLGALLVLLVFPQLHRLAAVALAVGVGAQAARLATRRAEAAVRLVRRSLPWLLASVGILAGLSVGWRTLQERRLVRSRPLAQPGAPNVLLLILDTVRAADLSLYGYSRATTPELERFAQRGTVFDRAFAAASWTTASHGSIFTGRWPSELGITWHRGLGPQWPMLSEVLRARGYATAAFVANEAYAGWETGLSRGFEHFDDYPRSLWTAVQGTAFGRRLYGPSRNRLAAIFGQLPGALARPAAMGGRAPIGAADQSGVSRLARSDPAKATRHGIPRAAESSTRSRSVAGATSATRATAAKSCTTSSTTCWSAGTWWAPL